MRALFPMSVIVSHYDIYIFIPMQTEIEFSFLKVTRIKDFAWEFRVRNNVLLMKKKKNRWHALLENYFCNHRCRYITSSCLPPPKKKSSFNQLRGHLGEGFCTMPRPDQIFWSVCCIVNYKNPVLYPNTNTQMCMHEREWMSVYIFLCMWGYLLIDNRNYCL